MIDVDKEEDSTDIVILDDARNKGKAVKSNSGVYGTIQAEVCERVDCSCCSYCLLCLASKFMHTYDFVYHFFPIFLYSTLWLNLLVQ